LEQLEPLKNIGKKIRFYRQQKKWSQEQLANKLGKNKSYISRVENGKERPNLEFLVSVADALGINVKDLFDDEYVVPAPKELQDIGMEWIVLNKELKEQGFTPEQIREIIKIAKMFQKL
jgi:transcriptional regulator with XRE-family HTH domain